MTMPELAPFPSATAKGLPLPIAIYYEHPVWFERLFAELDRRGTPYVKVRALSHFYDPLEPPASPEAGAISLLFNRMSPSAYRRDHGQVFYTLHYLSHLEAAGTRVLNGVEAFRHEISKALQLTLLRSLGLPAPRSRVIHDAAQALEAARAGGGLRFPVVIKPNVGAAGGGRRRRDSRRCDCRRGARRRGGGGRHRPGAGSCGAGAGVHSGARRPHPPPGDGGRQVSVRHQGVHQR
jgi:hypothetical protein